MLLIFPGLNGIDSMTVDVPVDVQLMNDVSDLTLL
jgi:hypothetical protein